jgi:uncharacterized protein with NRDE domain
MCTLIAFHRCAPGSPLWVAANRDEYLDRPAEGPALRWVADRPLVAPLDLRAGGTWWGLSATGVFAAVTNRPTRTPDPSRRSRGRLVLDVLQSGTAREAAAALADVPGSAYNPFNLFVADGREAFAAIYEEVPRVEPLEPGVHVIGNVDPNAREVTKIRRTLERAEALAGRPDDRVRAGLADLCRSHDGDGDPLASPCVHTELGYGTRSSTLLRLGADGGELRHAPGPPCATDYEDLTTLLSELARAAGSGARQLVERKAS